MNLIAKLVISLIIAIVAYTLSSILFTGTVQLSGGTFDLRLLLAFALATATTALVIRGRESHTTQTQTTTNSKAPSVQTATEHSDGNREEGEVKWFNISKGFGFIIKDDGEEIFVHFRSIRGEGRRGLRDGQRVSFIVAQSDKGPQAEDVLPE